MLLFGVGYGAASLGLDDGDFGTADFGLSAQNPSNMAIAVESLI
jgi:hypothetical protein